MDNLGDRYDFHSHTIFSDGKLLPAALIREAEIRGHKGLAITDHVDQSNIEDVIKKLTHFYKETKGKLPLKFFPGVEISYISPAHILEYAKKARKLGAKIIVVHGESPVEPVYPGTNHIAVSQKGLVDILAHPGNISLDDAKLAAANGVFLEITARSGHKDGNRHVADIARKSGAKLIVDTDSHTESDLITQEQAFKICKEAGLSDEEAIKTIKENPLELVKRIESR